MKKPEKPYQYSYQELSAFCLQIGLLLEAAVPLDEGLAIMAEDAGCEDEKQLLLYMAEGAELFFTSKKAPRDYCQARYPAEPFFVFGRESRGLPEDMLKKHWERCVRIPMREGARSLNLSNSVAIIAYEYLRQRDFAGLVKEGHLDAPEPAGGDWVDYV